MIQSKVNVNWSETLKHQMNENIYLEGKRGIIWNVKFVFVHCEEFHLIQSDGAFIWIQGSRHGVSMGCHPRPHSLPKNVKRVRVEEESVMKEEGAEKTTKVCSK